MIDFNTEPYYDDFSEENKFYRILFRPEVAVQARELNQIQSILQNQIKRHGDHIFKHGSVVVPGEFSINNNIDYVKISTPQSGDTTDVTNLIGTTITDSANVSVTAGLQAYVVHAVAATATDPAVLFISYTNASSGTSVYSTSTKLYTVTGVPYQVTTASSSPVGKGSVAIVKKGVYYVNGNFVMCEEQVQVLDKFNVLYNAENLFVKVGFNVVESIVTQDDEGYSSLLDNAQGSPNYSAPGAHRYFVDLILSVYNIDTEVSNFIELGRIVYAKPVYIKDKPDYSELEKTLARRTYDESGNYTVSGWEPDIREHRNNNRGTWSSANAYILGDVITSGGSTYFATHDITAGGTAPSHSYGNVNGWVWTDSPYYNRGIYPADSTYASGDSVPEGKGRADKLAIGFSAGKAYVKGFELEKIATTYVDVTKPRTLGVVDNNSSVSTAFGSYVIVKNVKGAPDITTAPLLNIYDTVGGTGYTIGSCRVRSILTETTATARYYIFDVVMNSGYDFSRNAKSIGTGTSLFANLTTDAYSAQLSGTITTSSNSLIGVGTNFLTQLKVNDTIYYSTSTGTVITAQIASITDDSHATLAGAPATPAASSIGFLQLASIIDPTSLSLVFPTSHVAVQSLTDHTYWITQPCTFTSAGNQLTVSAGTGVFESDSAQFFVLNASGLQHNSVSLVSGGGTATAVLDMGIATSSSWTVIATVKRTGVSARKTKTLTYTSNSYTVNSKITLSNTDIVSVLKIVAADGSNVTSWFEVDNGQRDSYYDYGVLNLISSNPIPPSPVTVYYSYYAHGSGDFFDVGSYSEYELIPSYKGVGLRDSIDFRPSKSGTSLVSFKTPTRGHNMTVDATYYLGRQDKISIDIFGKITDTLGSASTTPGLPDDPSDGMVLCNLSMLPYVFTTNDVTLTKIENKRYTMRDIGKLEKRIDTLEYYTSLSLLEHETANLNITDNAGMDRFKNGFIVDNFSGQGVGDVMSQDYLCSIDMDNNELRPFSSPESIDLVLDKTNSTHFKLYGDLVTLPLDSTTPHVKLAENSFASRTEYVNPFAVFTFIGDVKINPASDDWIEVDRRPDVISSVEGNYNALATIAEKSGVIGTVWNAWQDTWFGQSTVVNTNTVGGYIQNGQISYNEFNALYGTANLSGSVVSNKSVGARYVTLETSATQVGQSRTGIKTSIVEKIDTKLVDDKVVSTAVIPYIRSRNVLVQVKGMKPNTTLYPYFDNIAISTYCTPATRIQYTPVSGTFDLTTNVGEAVNTDTARRISGDSQSCLNIGDKITGSSSNATGILVGKDVITNPGTGALTYYLYVVNVIGTFTTSDTVSGSISGATGTATAITTAVSGGALTTSASGSLYLLFNIPNTDSVRFRTGSREFKLIDNSVSAAGQFTTRGRSTYSAAGILQTKQASYTSTRNAEIVQEAVSDNQTITQTSTKVVGDTGWYDPLAQSFLVDSKGGAFLSKVDLYFAAKDNNIPVTVEIREMINGYPGKTVLPFSRVTLQASDVNLSSNTVSDFNGVNYPTFDTPTTVTFSSPVYVNDATEYALVIMSDSNAYKVWISNLGDQIPGTSNSISEQPYNGVLFKSQNASTWSPDQMQDLKFTIWRANFDISTTGGIILTSGNNTHYTLEQDPIQTNNGSNVVRVWHKNHGFIAGDKVQFLDAMTVNGINFSANTDYTILANPTLDSYTIAPSATTASSSGYGGGSSVKATRNIRFETLYPAVNSLQFPETTVSYTLSTYTYSTGALDTTIPVNINDNNYFLSSKVTATSTKPLKIYSTFKSTNNAITPVIDTQRCSAVAVANKIDTPSEGLWNTATVDSNILLSSQSCVLTGSTLTPASSGNKDIVKRIIPGSYITFSGSSTNSAYNNMKLLVSGVDTANGVITLSGVSFTTETVGLTVTYYAFFVSEIAPVGSSSTSKYVSKVIQLAQASNGIKVKLAASVPNEADVLVYYKTGTSGTDFNSTNWTLLPPDAAIKKTSILSDTFYDVDYSVYNLAAFDKLSVKVVMQSTNAAAAPRVKDLRIIACA